MRTILWLGAHKTGTTYLQKSLDLSQAALRDAGVHYVELEEFRVKYGRPLLNADGAEPAPNEFSPPGTMTSLVFDENIPGYVQHALSRRGFYPDMEQRADTITDYLGLAPDDIVLGVRRYDGFLPSLYCETLKSTPFQTFDDYLVNAFAPRRGPRRATVPEADGFTRMNWAGLVTRLAEHYPAANVRVYFYEALRGNEAQLLSEIIGIPAGDIQLLETEERVGFSRRAVKRLHKLGEQRPVTRADVRRLVRKFPSGAEFGSFAPFDDSERAVLAERYRVDCDAVKADERVEIVELG